jgi:hypothetical protein
MVRSPGSLVLEWPTETARATAMLPLDLAQALHLPPTPENPGLPTLVGAFAPRASPTVFFGFDAFATE